MRQAVGAIVIAAGLAGCSLPIDRMHALVAREGIHDPWAVGTTRRFTGHAMVTALDGLHAIGNEFCIATRHYVPVPTIFGDRNERLKHTERAVALAPCRIARPDQFQDIYGPFTEADINVALTAVLAFARSNGSAPNGVAVDDQYGHPHSDMQELAQPDNFRGIFENTPWESWAGKRFQPDGRMNIEFANEALRGNHLRFTVTIREGRVAAIMYINGTTGMNH